MAFYNTNMKKAHKYVIKKTGNYVSYQGDHLTTSTRYTRTYHNNVSQDFCFTTCKHPHSICLTPNHYTTV